MSEELETARRYRLHARELRTIAERMVTQPSRHVLVAVANDYDKMANALEAIDRANDGAKTARSH